jgi:tripartite-type tricarboxylate transporter receptor subunit TctC
MATAVPSLPQNNAMGNAMKRAILIGALAALTCFETGAQAQTYPTRPITMFVGFPPGGPTDTLARIVADGMKNALGQTIAVETVSGAGGTIATGRVVHAAPDGYTIGIGQWNSHVGSPAIYPLDYDVLNDLQPISLLTSSPNWVLGKSDLPPKSGAELIAWLKGHSEPVTYATVGAGSPSHLIAITLAKATGAHFQLVPYRGAAPVMQDMIGGQIEMTGLEASGSFPNVQSGRLKAFAVTSAKRWAKSPDTPTFVELGVPDLVINFWHGLWTTKGVPNDVVDRLNAAVRTALADPAVRQRIEGLGQTIFPSDQQTPQALAAYNKAEIDRWWPVIKAAGIKASE